MWKKIGNGVRNFRVGDQLNSGPRMMVTISFVISNLSFTSSRSAFVAKTYLIGLSSAHANISTINGYRVVIYLADHRPAHVHVIGAGFEVVFNLNCPD